MTGLTQEQFDALPASTQAFLREQGMAPGAAQATASAPQAPSQALPAGLPDLDAIPDQSSRGPDYMPYDREYDIDGVLHQVQHRFSERSGPNFYAEFTVTRASESAVLAGIVEGSKRAYAWYYNPGSFGKEKDKSDAAQRRFREFVQQISGLPEGSPVNSTTAQLLGKSQSQPDIGIRFRAISVRGNENKNKPGTYYHNQRVMPIA